MHWKNIMIRNLLIGIGVAAAMTCSISTSWSAGNASKKFIKHAMECNLAEIQVGKLAQEKGQKDGVRAFGQMLATDHADANQKATEAAGALGVAPPTEPSRKQKALYDKLSKLSGDTFDRQFAMEMVADHRKDVREYEKEARKKNDPAADYANQSLPVLRKHLQTAQSL